MKKLLLPLLACLITQVHAQVTNFKIHAGINYPWIKENREKPEPAGPGIPIASGGNYYVSNIGVLVENFETSPGLDIGTTFTIFQNKNLFIETGAAVQYFRYKRLVTIKSLSQQSILPGLGEKIDIVGTPFPLLNVTHYNQDTGGTYEPILVGPSVTGELPEPDDNLGKTETLYLQLPVVIGKKFLQNKLIVQTGLSADVLVYASVYKYKHDGATSGLIKDNNKNEFNTVLITGRLQTTYLVRKNIGIDLSYHRSFNSIYRNTEIESTNCNVLSLGVSFHFASKQSTL